MVAVTSIFLTNLMELNIPNWLTASVQRIYTVIILCKKKTQNNFLILNYLLYIYRVYNKYSYFLHPSIICYHFI